jgi:hypothetical protein
MVVEARFHQKIVGSAPVVVVAFIGTSPYGSRRFLSHGVRPVRKAVRTR